LPGYLFAIDMGAQVILDTDDDNIPAAAVPYVLDTDANGDVCADVVNRSQIAWNAYRHFGVPHLHNRGSPLPALPPFPGPSHRERERARARLYVFMCARVCSCLCDTHTHTQTHTHRSAAAARAPGPTARVREAPARAPPDPTGRSALRSRPGCHSTAHYEPFLYFRRDFL